MASLLEFLLKFRAEDGRYVPLDPSCNKYRHYGTEHPRGVVLNKEEVLYLFDPSFKTSNKHMVMYQMLKSEGFNLFRFDDRTDKYFIYIRTANFNRKKALPIATVDLVSKNEDFCGRLSFFHNKPALFCVRSSYEVSFIQVTSVEKLSLACDKKMYKKKRHKECLSD